LVMNFPMSIHVFRIAAVFTSKFSVTDRTIVEPAGKGAGCPSNTSMPKCEHSPSMNFIKASLCCCRRSFFPCRTLNVIADLDATSRVMKRTIHQLSSGAWSGCFVTKSSSMMILLSHSQLSVLLADNHLEVMILGHLLFSLVQLIRLLRSFIGFRVKS
jgi:hypothetical protein